jgi:hypothetical protein
MSIHVIATSSCNSNQRLDFGASSFIILLKSLASEQSMVQAANRKNHNQCKNTVTSYSRSSNLFFSCMIKIYQQLSTADPK